jgi:hypothetical protein
LPSKVVKSSDSFPVTFTSENKTKKNRKFLGFFDPEKKMATRSYDKQGTQKISGLSAEVSFTILFQGHVSDRYKIHFKYSLFINSKYLHSAPMNLEISIKALAHMQ